MVSNNELYDICASKAAKSGLHAMAAGLIQLGWSVDGVREELMYMHGCLGSIGMSLAKLADSAEMVAFSDNRLLSEETEQALVGALQNFRDNDG